ncbi:protein S40-6-like [Typha latifolia]|uniref:protein S40-6-like n=1 Tax=Typha latifolia TaxID=4733 RepID=UPI003C2D8DE2
MAKGSRYAADRLLGTHGYGGGHVPGTDFLELAEEEVWDSAHRAAPGRAPRCHPPPACYSPSPSQPADGRHAASSAPVRVPEWGRIEPGESDADRARVEWVPPHEYLAREHASVVEGAGRTLKGRDVIRVRDAVWSQTGFFG